MSKKNIEPTEPTKTVEMPSDVRSYFAGKELRVCSTFGKYTRGQLESYLLGRLTDGSAELDRIFEDASVDLKGRAVQYVIDAGYTRTERPVAPPEEGGIKSLKRPLTEPKPRRGLFGRG